MSTEQNELVRMRLGELLTEAQQIEKSMRDRWSANAPITPASVAVLATRTEALSRDLRELADYPSEATRAMNLHGLQEAIGVLEPLTHRPGEYMGIPRDRYEASIHDKPGYCPQCRRLTVTTDDNRCLKCGWTKAPRQS